MRLNGSGSDPKKGWNTYMIHKITYILKNLIVGIEKSQIWQIQVFRLNLDPYTSLPTNRIRVPRITRGQQYIVKVN